MWMPEGAFLIHSTPYLSVQYVFMYIFMYVYMYVFETGSYYVALADYVALPIPPEYWN